MSEHVVSYREAPTNEGGPLGRELKVDLSSGYVYDASGNQIDKWDAADNEQSSMLADYVAESVHLQAAYSLSRVDPQRAAVMMSSRPGEEVVNMDLGISDVHIPAALPNFASGYRNEPPIADMVSPPLLVGKQVDNFFQFDKNDAFQRAQPMGSGAGEVGEIHPRLANDQYSAKERAIGSWVSTQLEANADTPLRLMQAAAKRVMNAHTIERELRVKTLALTSGTWDSSVVIALGGTANWNGGSTSDPIKDLQTAVLNSWGKPTAIVLASPLWFAFLRNPNVQKYFAFKDGMAPMPSAGEVSSKFGLPPIVVGEMQYIDTSNAKSYIWGTSALLIRQPEQLPPVTQDDVASSYTFRFNVPAPRDGASSGGFIVRRFFTQNRGSLGGEKIVVVSFDAEKQTSKYAGGLITGAYV